VIGSLDGANEQIRVRHIAERAVDDMLREIQRLFDEFAGVHGPSFLPDIKMRTSLHDDGRDSRAGSLYGSAGDLAPLLIYQRQSWTVPALPISGDDTRGRTASLCARQSYR